MLLTNEPQNGGRRMGLRSFANVRRLRTVMQDPKFDIRTFDPVRIKGLPVYADTQVQDISLLCYVAGVALMHGSGAPVAVGRESCLALLDLMICEEGKWLRGTLQHALAARRAYNAEWNTTAGGDPEDRVHRAYTYHKLMLHPANTIAHTVASMWPDLRVWPDDDDYDQQGAEVQFRHVRSLKRVMGYPWHGGLFDQYTQPHKTLTTTGSLMP